MQPFSIQCTTCRRSLRVVNPEAIGQIVSCPKCGSMVMVHAPAAWDPQAPSESASSVSKSSVVTDQSAVTPSRNLEQSAAEAFLDTGSCPVAGQSFGSVVGRGAGDVGSHSAICKNAACGNSTGRQNSGGAGEKNAVEESAERRVGGSGFDTEKRNGARRNRPART